MFGELSNCQTAVACVHELQHASPLLRLFARFWSRFLPCSLSYYQLCASQHTGRVHSPMEDQENAGQQRRAAVKGGGPAARHGTSKGATGYAAGATRRSQRAPKATKPQ